MKYNRKSTTAKSVAQAAPIAPHRKINGILMPTLRQILNHS